MTGVTEECAIEVGRGFFKNTRAGFDIMLVENLGCTATVAGVRIVYRPDTTADARIDEGLCAGRRAAMGRAGFKGDVDVGTLSRITGGSKRRKASSARTLAELTSPPKTPPNRLDCRQPVDTL